nr:MAG TPA: hypothetical protein [Caudoviricetes sp.]
MYYIQQIVLLQQNVLYTTICIVFYIDIIQIVSYNKYNKWYY